MRLHRILQRKKEQTLTSHYIKAIVSDAFRKVFDTLSRRFGNIYIKEYGKLDGLAVGIILDEKYYFRVKSDVAVLITIKEEASAQTKVEIVSCAGGHGLLGLSYNAHSDYAREVRDHIRNSGLNIDSEIEISYFSREKCKLPNE